MSATTTQLLSGDEFCKLRYTLHLLKVHLQTFISVPITQKCQILICDTLVASERNDGPRNKCVPWIFTKLRSVPRGGKKKRWGGGRTIGYEVPLTACALSGHLRRVTYKEPDAVCIQWFLLMMSTILLETCRGIWKQNVINKGRIKLEHEIKFKFCFMVKPTGLRVSLMAKVLPKASPHSS